MLNIKLIKEIVKDSNHKTCMSVIGAIEDGDIEIYKNKENYINDGFNLKNKNSYTLLSSGQIAHYIQ